MEGGREGDREEREEDRMQNTYYINIVESKYKERILQTVSVSVSHLQSRRRMC